KAPFIGGDTTLTLRLTVKDASGRVTSDDVNVAVKDIGLSAPLSSSVSDLQILPNPSHPGSGGTHFQYSLGAPSDITIVIRDLFGHLVREITIPRGESGALAGLNS